MNKMIKRRAIFFALAVVVVTSAVVKCIDLREPSYNGKTLGAWLRQLNEAESEEFISAAPWTPWRFEQSPEQREAAEVIRTMGRETLPHLVRMLRGGDARRNACAKYMPKWIDLSTSSKEALERRCQSISAAIALGPSAKPMLPDLVGVLYGSDSVISKRAALALAAIGPEGHALLRQAIAGTNCIASRVAVIALGSDLARASKRISGLEVSADFVESNEVLAADWVGQETRQYGKDVVNLIGKGLESPDTAVRYNSAIALGEFRLAATEAIPTLKILLQDRDLHVRIAASNALSQIRSAN